MSLRSKFGGPKRAWYIRRQFTYSWGRNIKDRLVTEYLCASAGKWIASFETVYPYSRGDAEKKAFWMTATDPDTIGQISVVCRRVPLPIRYRLSR